MIESNKGLFGATTPNVKDKKTRSGYKRQERDAYYTPEWPTNDCLLPLINLTSDVLEPAVGDGGIKKVLQAHGHNVLGIDIHPDPAVDLVQDFLLWDNPNNIAFDIVTNPPFNQPKGISTKFIEHSLNLTKPYKGKVAMLLPIAYCRAKTRQHLFENHRAFAMKIELTKRISWTNLKHKTYNSGKPVTPMQDLCWCIWDWTHSGDAVLKIMPQETGLKTPLEQAIEEKAVD